MPNCASGFTPRRRTFARRHAALAILATAGLAAACADDAGISTSGSGGGSTGSATSTVGTGSPTSSSSTSGTTSTESAGGAGQGGSGQGGSGQGGSGQGGSGQGGSGGLGQGGSGGLGQGGSGGLGQGGSGQGPGGTGGSGGAGGSGPCLVDLDCDDGVACTVDSCDLGTSTCINAPDDVACDDGASCTGVETCGANGCEAGTPVDCDDGLGCTADFCDLGADTCANVPQDVACSDGLFCNGSEQCDVTQGCLAGVAPSCDDGLGCTADACDEGADACAFAPNNGACADADLCDGAEVCDPQLGCIEGAPLACDDGIACTFDTCNGATGCVATTNDAACDDGSNCNGVDVCDAQLGCLDGTPVLCPGDGIACTIEACNEADLSCSSTPSNGACPNGQFCVPQQGGCVVGTPCNGPGDCTDADPCNGIEACVAGTCEPGQAVVCDDGIACTFEQCDPGTGQCETFPQDEDCEDGNACNGTSTCQVGTGCVSSAPVVCNDGVACTEDQCNPVNGACSAPPNHAACSDGEPCNGAEQCGAGGCVGSAPLVCPGDGIACTEEICVVGLGCRSTPDDSLCPCTQTCSVQNGGCGNFCQIGECQGKVYECGDCLDNDGDCRIDAGDTQCLGACDNTEDSFYGGIPGQNNAPCKSDCYFDQDTGAGNDECYWSHECDPLSVAPNYPPEGSQCEYDPGASIPGYPGNNDCTNAFNTQSAECAAYCGPLTPNGCDCFGCCAIPGAPTTVWLGSEVGNDGSCTIDDLDDPALCKPCTQVPACLNTCENCEICIGKPELPPECAEQVCPGGAQRCGQGGQAACPAGEYCVTGCCQQTAQ